MRRLLKLLLNLFRFKSKKIFSESRILVTVPGASFDLFSGNVHSYFGFVDLTTLHHGDEVEMSEYIRPWSNKEFLLHRTQKFNGPLDIPLISFPFKVLDCPAKIVLKQNTGMSREIWYLFRYD